MTDESHYEVLGVSSNADLSQIRASYVSLLKRYHPDQRGVSDTQESSAQVQRIVGAYRTLKDPAARSKYDAALRSMARPTSSLKSTPPPRRKSHLRSARFKLDRDTMFCVAMLTTAAVGLHLLVSRFVESHPVATAPRTTSAREIAANTQFEAIISNAGIMSRQEASNYSSRCFAAARRNRNPTAADPCVGFDMAYVYWREASGLTDPYFQPDTISSRASDAFSGLSPNGAAVHVQFIREATLRTIMRMPSPADEFAIAFTGSQTDPTISAGQQAAETSPAKD